MSGGAKMFMTLPGLLLILAINVLIGTAIGAAIAVVILRKQTTWKAVLWTSLASILCWIYALHLSDLAGVSGYPSGGKWVMLPWRTGTPWQNLIGDHAYMFASVSAVVAGITSILIRSKLAANRNI
jgi:hypothetical protein